MERHLVMSHKELERKRVLTQVKEKRLSLREAHGLLGLSYRHTLRVYQRFVRQGDKGLVHRSRGHASNRRKDAKFRQKVIEQYVGRYEPFDLGPTLAAEKLAEDGLVVDHETLRRWLLAEGHWKKRRKRREHRTRRERRAHFGEMVQMDGSPHPWFGPEHPSTCLMEMVDDATSAALSLMDEQETTELAMRLLWRWVDRYGVPQTLYTDKKSVFTTTREATLDEQLRGEEPMTNFGKACHKLGIRIILADSPQAKGRVERKHGLLQDRFVKELALRGLKTIEEANAVLKDGFLDALNDKFAEPPLDPEDYHRPVPAGLDLADVFCFEQTRTVQNDWTVRHENRYLQIARDNTLLPKPKDKVLVRTRLDGQTILLYRGAALKFCPVTNEQLAQQHAKPAVHAQATGSKPAAPPRNSPWRQNSTLMASDTKAASQ